MRASVYGVILLSVGVLGVGLLAGCGASGGRVPCPEAWATVAPLPSADHADGEPASVDDRRLYMRLLQAAVRLHEDGKATPMATLREQLSRKTCRLALPPGADRPVASPDLYRRARDSVLMIGRLYKCDKCEHWHLGMAAGFVLTASGAVATNYHVVDKADSAALVVMAGDGRVLPVREVLAADKVNDVAILQLDGQGPAPLPLGPEAPVGTAARVISHPERHFYMMTEGIVARYFTARAIDSHGPRVAITAEYAKGSSGAPVFDDCGRVIALVESTHSIYYDKDEDGKEQHLQMVLRQCIPVRCLRALVVE